MFVPISLRHATLGLAFLGLAACCVWSAESENGSKSKVEPGWKEKIRRALDKPVTLDVVDVPLLDVASQLGKQAGVPNLRLDVKALDDMGIGADACVTRYLERVPLRDVLWLVLRDLDLTYMLRDGALVITTPEEAEHQLITETFYVLDLVRPHDQAGPEERDYDSLTSLIVTMVAPTSWRGGSGPGPIDVLRGMLVISQTQDVLGEIRDLLVTLRAARKLYRERRKETRLITSLPVGGHPGEGIVAALSRKGNFEFKKLPLAVAAARLQEIYKVPILVDHHVLAEIGIDSDSPVSFSGSNLALRDALRPMLRQLDITFVPLRSFVLITTPEESDTLLVTRVYPIADLVLGLYLPPTRTANTRVWCDYDTVIDVITSNVAPATWGDMGGAGFIEAEPNSVSLVVSQAYEIHEQIEQLLTKIRTTIPKEVTAEATVDAGRKESLRLMVYFVQTKSSMRGSAHGDEEKQTAPESPVGQRPQSQTLAQRGLAPSGFYLRDGTAPALFDDEELLQVIQELVEPDSWNKDGVYARAAPGRLIIRQSSDVHRKIGQMLSRLGVAYQDRVDTPDNGFGGDTRALGGGMGGGFF